MEGRGYKPQKVEASRNWEQPSAYTQEEKGNSFKHQELNSNSNSREQETDSPLVIPERHETYQHIDFSLARAVPDL